MFYFVPFQFSYLLNIFDLKSLDFLKRTILSTFAVLILVGNTFIKSRRFEELENSPTIKDTFIIS